MTSEEARERFSEAVDGELSDGDRRAFDAALAADGLLRDEFHAFEATHARFKAEAKKADAPKAGMVDRVQREIHRQSGGRFYRDRFSRLSPAAQTDILVALVIGLLVIAGLWFAFRVVGKDTLPPRKYEVKVPQMMNVPLVIPTVTPTQCRNDYERIVGSVGLASAHQALLVELPSVAEPVVPVRVGLPRLTYAGDEVYLQAVPLMSATSQGRAVDIQKYASGGIAVAGKPLADNPVTLNRDWHYGFELIADQHLPLAKIKADVALIADHKLLFTVDITGGAPASRGWTEQVWAKAKSAPDAQARAAIRVAAAERAASGCLVAKPVLARLILGGESGHAGGYEVSDAVALEQAIIVDCACQGVDLDSVAHLLARSPSSAQGHLAVKLAPSAPEADLTVDDRATVADLVRAIVRRMHGKLPDFDHPIRVYLAPAGPVEEPTNGLLAPKRN